MSKTNSNKNDEENKNEDKFEDDLELTTNFLDGDESENNNEEDAKLNGDSVITGGVTISKTKIVLAKKLLDNIKENNDKLIRLLAGSMSPEDEARISIGQASEEDFNADNAGLNEEVESESGRITEGVFDGENMIGPDGKQYSVPANYASKSKLVEGDILKLTITPAGTFVYKQIGPIERSRVVGLLEQGDSGNFIVTSENRKWRVLTASVTYYKGSAGDEVVILVPMTGQSQWAAVDNIVRNK